MKQLCAAVLTLLMVGALSAQTYDQYFSAIKNKRIKEGYTLQRVVTREGKPNPGMIMEHMTLVPYTEYYFVGVMRKEPANLKAIIDLSQPIPGTSDVRKEFSSAVSKEIDDKGNLNYVYRAKVTNDRDLANVSLDLTFYEDEFKYSPAYVLIFTRPAK